MKILEILDDCGDTLDIEEWVESFDGLNPVDEIALVKQGSHAMKLGIDADLAVNDFAAWATVHAYGDWSKYKNDWIYLWVYFSSLSYVPASGVVLYFDIGSDADNRIVFDRTKAELSIGWNLLKLDLNAPDLSPGVIDWSDINYMRIFIYEAAANTNDFSIYVDSIMFVGRKSPRNILSNILRDILGI